MFNEVPNSANRAYSSGRREGGDRLKTGNLIETPRLVLKLQSLHDFDRFYAMSKDPEVMAYIGDGSVFHWTRKVAFAKFRDQISATVVVGLGTRAIYRKRDALYLGWCSVAPSAFLKHMELGYRLCRDAWGKGYATEAAEALLAAAYCRTDVDRIMACVHPGNAASLRVLKKLGFTQCGTKFSKPISMEIPVYHIDRKGKATIKVG